VTGEATPGSDAAVDIEPPPYDVLAVSYTHLKLPTIYSV